MGNALENVTLADYKSVKVRVNVENDVEISYLDFLSAIRQGKVRHTSKSGKILVYLNDAVKHFNSEFESTRKVILRDGHEKYEKCFGKGKLTCLDRDVQDDMLSFADSDAISRLEFYNASHRNRKMFEN